MGMIEKVRSGFHGVIEPDPQRVLSAAHGGRRLFLFNVITVHSAEGVRFAGSEMPLPVESTVTPVQGEAVTRIQDTVK